MARERKARYDAKRTNAFYFDPDKLVIIGLDTDDGPEHHLHDSRIGLPLDEGMIRSIMAHGVKVPIIVAKIDDKPHVVDGRQRVRHAREANRRLVAAGEPAVRVPAMDEKGNERQQQLLAIGLNEQRRADDVLVKAEKARRLRDRGFDDAEIGIAFGISTQAARQWLDVDSLAEPVKARISSGEVSATAARQVAGLDPTRQAEIIEGAVASGQTTVTEVKAAAKRAKGETVKKAPGKRALRKMVEQAGPENATHPVVLGLRFALGDVTLADIEAAGWSREGWQDEGGAR